MAGENHEVELKFEIDPEQARALIAHLSPGGAPPARRLESIYFDTSDQALRKRGFTLRVRKDGRRWTQTVKTCATSSGATRGEWAAPVKGGSPDLDLLQSSPAGAGPSLDCGVPGARLKPPQNRRVARSCATVKSSSGPFGTMRVGLIRA